MKKFSEMKQSEIKHLINEFELAQIDGIPKQGSRKWYLLEFTHWILGEILAGKNPLVD